MVFVESFYSLSSVPSKKLIQTWLGITCRVGLVFGRFRKTSLVIVNLAGHCIKATLVNVYRPYWVRCNRSYWASYTSLTGRYVHVRVVVVYRPDWMLLECIHGGRHNQTQMFYCCFSAILYHFPDHLYKYVVSS